MIHISSGLSDADRVRAIAAGPTLVPAEADYARLLDAAGFVEVEEIGLTEEYRATAAAWLDQSERAASDLEPIFGVEEFRTAQQDRREALAAIDDGLLRRSLFVARRP